MRAWLAGGVACSVVLGLWLRASSEAPDPLRLVPPQADLVVKIENPRNLADLVYHHEVVQEFQKIDTLRELYDTTNFRRLTQLIAYFEKQLDTDALTILEKIAGGGVVLAAKFAEPPAALAIFQGKDARVQRRFLDLALEVVEQELARQDKKERIFKSTYRKIETIHLGKQVHLALVDAALLWASDAKVLEKALDLHLDPKAANVTGLPAFQQRLTLLPEQPLGWVWLNLESVRQLPQVKTALETVSADPNNLILQGGLIDVIKRAPVLCASIEQQGKDFLASLRMPAGRKGMAPVAAMVLPEDGRGSLPLLQPSQVLASVSYFLDLGKLWENRGKIFNKAQMKALEEFDANSGRFLGGTKMSKLFQLAGNHHRLVVVQQDQTSYKVEPTTRIPGFALIVDMRDPEFSKSMDTVLRGVALIGSFQYGLRMVEEKRDGHKIVSYYFPEDKPLKNDPNGLYYNFSPAFTHVGDQFIASSTVELARELVDLVGKEGKDASPATMRTHLYAKGGAAALRAAQEQLLAQTILGQGLPPGSARKQIDAFIDLVGKLGVVQLQVNYGADDFRYDVRWQRK